MNKKYNTDSERIAAKRRSRLAWYYKNKAKVSAQPTNTVPPLEVPQEFWDKVEALEKLRKQAVIAKEAEARARCGKIDAAFDKLFNEVFRKKSV